MPSIIIIFYYLLLLLLLGLNLEYLKKIICKIPLVSCLPARLLSSGCPRTARTESHWSLPLYIITRSQKWL